MWLFFLQQTLVFQAFRAIETSPQRAFHADTWNEMHRSACKWQALENLTHLKISRTDQGHLAKDNQQNRGLCCHCFSKEEAVHQLWNTPEEQHYIFTSGNNGPAAQRSWSRLLLWDDMLLYIPIWIRLLWNVRKCVVSGRHHQCPLLPSIARSQRLFCNHILFEFDCHIQSGSSY